MYQQFFSLQRQPFSIEPDPHFLFFTDQHKEALAHLTYGLQGNGGFVVLTGEVGSGKTSVCQYLLQEMHKNTDIASISNPAVSEIDLLVDICNQFSIDYDRNNITLKVMFDALASWMLRNQQRGRHAIVLIDEAQHLSFNGLEQLRLITNIESDNLKPLQIILIGQTALQEKLLTNELRQLSQRITARYHLCALNKQESEFYIHHRLNKAGAKGPIFSPKSSSMIFKASAGNPRLINRICDRCLITAYTQSSFSVTPAITKKAINESELPQKESCWKVYIPRLIGLLVVLLGALIINNQASTISRYLDGNTKTNTDTQVMTHEWLDVINSASVQTVTGTHSIADDLLTPNSLLQTLPDTHFSLQLAAFANKTLVQEFFVSYPLLKENSYLYQSQRSEKSKYVILLGNFETYKMAKLASKTLTTRFPRIEPWIKDYRTIQHDIQ